MKIFPVQSNRITYSKFPSKKNNLYGSNSVCAYNINFTSLKQTTGNENLFIDTAFYRDLPTLIGFTKLMQEQFPDGADIMDFACSNGEEAISLYSLLNDKDAPKYKIHCYDTSDKAIELARNNIYSVNNHNHYDYFLLYSNNDKLKSDVRRCFNDLMEEISRPDINLNDERYVEYLKTISVYFNEKYYKVKDQYKHNFKFEKGDIRNILNIEPDKQVGAVFFRNALYHITNNHVFDNVYDKQTIDRIWNTDKYAAIQDVVDKVYEKLLPGGFLVLGNDEKEHIYQADKYTPKEEIFFDERSMEYLRIKSPLLKALKKDGKFVPVCSTKCETSSMGDLTVYTVWQKVEK